jgi:hypothetical protein
MWHPIIETFGVIAALAFGSILAVYFAHLLAKDRERINGAKTRRREFFNLAYEIKATMKAKIINQLPDKWVPVFIQNAPQLKAGFDQIAGDLSDAERVKLNSAVEEIVAFSNLTPFEIYTNQNKLLEAFENFPEI